MTTRADLLCKLFLHIIRNCGYESTSMVYSCKKGSVFYVKDTKSGEEFKVKFARVEPEKEPGEDIVKVFESVVPPVSPKKKNRISNFN